MISVTLRKVLRKDWDFILKLRNSDEFRTNFYNQHIISKKEHYDYLTKQKNNQNFTNWIICYADKDVGCIRILDKDVSIIIDKKFQSKGIGTKALSLIENEAKKLLERMGCGYKNKKALIPAYRADIIHQVDLAEDISIAYGYENFKAIIPNVATIAEEDKFEIFKNKISNLLVDLDLMETSTYNLTNKELKCRRIS